MKILILGYSRSGQSAYNLLKDNNEIFIYDKNKKNMPNFLSYADLKKKMIFFDLVIRSPGIKITSKVYQLAVQLSNKIISELELGLSYIKDNYIIGVTGSNGKTTLVNMLEFLLKNKYKVHKLGNIGIPLTSQVKDIRKNDIVVLEISSFQLENTYSKYFDIGVITNILDNHFDSVFSKECYIASKLKLVNLSKKIYCDKTVYTNYSINKKYYKIEELEEYKNENLNMYNQLYFNIACDIALSLNVDKKYIEEIKYQFLMKHYRMEKVLETDNLIFINDSKSTSIASTNACLNIYTDRPRLIIIGGISKNESFTKLNKREGDIVFSFGKSKFKIFNQMGDYYFDTLEELLNYIKMKFNKDYYVIFSPSCASFDQYKNYEDRGNSFNILINNIFLR